MASLMPWDSPCAADTVSAALDLPGGPSSGTAAGVACTALAFPFLSGRCPEAVVSAARAARRPQTLGAGRVHSLP